MSGRAVARARAELGALVAASGLVDVAWLMPDETGFFQPLLVGTGRAPSA